MTNTEERMGQDLDERKASDARRVSRTIYGAFWSLQDAVVLIRQGDAKFGDAEKEELLALEAAVGKFARAVGERVGFTPS